MQALLSDLSVNPLLQDWILHHGLPPFDQINAEDFEPAFDVALARNWAEIEAIASNLAEPNFDNTLAAFDASGRLLNRVGHLFHNLTDHIQIEEKRNVKGAEGKGSSELLSIEKKYDKPMSYWFALVNGHSGRKHMEIVQWLKEEHGMGHGHANAVVAHCHAQGGQAAELSGNQLPTSAMVVWARFEGQLAVPASTRFGHEVAIANGPILVVGLPSRLSASGWSDFQKVVDENRLQRFAAGCR